MHMARKQEMTKLLKCLYVLVKRMDAQTAIAVSCYGLLVGVHRSNPSLRTTMEGARSVEQAINHCLQLYGGVTMGTEAKSILEELKGTVGGISTSSSSDVSADVMWVKMLQEWALTQCSVTLTGLLRIEKLRGWPVHEKRAEKLRYLHLLRSLNGCLQRLEEAFRRSDWEESVQDTILTHETAKIFWNNHFRGCSEVTTAAFLEAFTWDFGGIDEREISLLKKRLTTPITPTKINIIDVELFSFIFGMMGGLLLDGHQQVLQGKTSSDATSDLNSAPPTIPPCIVTDDNINIISTAAPTPAPAPAPAPAAAEIPGGQSQSSPGSTVDSSSPPVHARAAPMMPVSPVLMKHPIKAPGNLATIAESHGNENSNIRLQHSTEDDETHRSMSMTNSTSPLVNETNGTVIGPSRMIKVFDQRTGRYRKMDIACFQTESQCAQAALQLHAIPMDRSGIVVTFRDSEGDTGELSLSSSLPITAGDIAAITVVMAT
jgi:hypothetical protein